MAAFYVIFIVLVLFDQLFKYLAINNLANSDSFQVIPGFLQWTYLENRGAAWGIFSNYTWILGIVSLFVVILCLYLVIKEKFSSLYEKISIIIIAAGGFGNCIDRLFRGYVVDYIDISQLFEYPIFNFADCCVVIGAIILVIYELFFNKDKKDEKQDNS